MKKEYPKIFLKGKSVSLLSLAMLLTACGGINEEINQGLGSVPLGENTANDNTEVDEEDSTTGNNPAISPGFNFQIINSERQLITPLQDGDVLDLNVLPSLFNIEAIELSNSFLSVGMLITGDGYRVDRVEERPIWTLNSETIGFKGEAGIYTITAQGYDIDGAEGEIIGESSITISFQDQALSNQRPIATNDNAEVSVNATLSNINILMNDTDPDNDILNVVSAEADIGDVSIIDNQLTYTPPPGFIGDALISYSITDGNLNDSATLSIHIVNTSAEVALQWEKPNSLYDGTAFSDNDIAGYEILYRVVGDTAYQKIVVDDVNTLSVEVESLAVSGNVEFTIATLSEEGFYSHFTDLITLNL